MILILAVLVAEIVGTLVGFGSSIILLPIFLSYYPFGTALIMTAFIQLVGNIIRFIVLRQKVDAKLIIKFGIPSVICAIFGAILIDYINIGILVRFLGLVITGIALFELFDRKYFMIKPTPVRLITCGSLSGFFAGLVGTGGMVRGAFLETMRLKKSSYLVTMAMVAIVTDVARLGVYSQSVFYSSIDFSLLLILVSFSVIAVLIGEYVVKFIPHKIFHKLVLSILLIAGIKIILLG